MIEPQMVGRSTEFARLRDAVERAVTHRTGGLLFLLGPEGIGKSRLARELAAASAARAVVLVGRFLPPGTDITFWPLTEAFNRLGGRTNAIADRHAHRHLILQRLATGRVEDRLWAAGQLIDAISRDQPVIVILDDLQWAEPALFDFADRWSAASTDNPVLVLALCRPPLPRGQQGGTRGAQDSAITLSPLAADACEQLAGSILGADWPNPRIAAKVMTAGEGNPLFLEQAFALMASIDDWPADLSSGMPEPVIAARLARLPWPERVIVQAAAIQGEAFDARLLARLLPDRLRPDLQQHLTSLAQRLIVIPDWPAEPGQARWRFRHLLIRDAAYDALAGPQRASLHRRLADLLEQAPPGLPGEERDALIGYHLEQACAPSGEPADAPGRTTLRRSAGAVLGSAGRQAYARADLAGRSAANLLGRAVAVLPDDDPLRRDLLPELAAAQAETAQFDRALETIESARRIAHSAGDGRLVARITVEDMWRRFHVDPGMQVGQAIQEIGEAIAALEQIGDDRALARALFAYGSCLFSRGQAEPAAEYLRRAVRHAHAAGERRAEIDASWQVMGPLFFGPAPARQAIEITHELRDQVDPVSQPYAFMLEIEAILSAMLGWLETANEVHHRAELMYEDLGVSAAEVGLPQYSCRLRLLAGDAQTAADELSGHWQALERRGETGYLSSTAAQLAEVQYRLGKYDDALAAAETARQTGTADDFASQMLWRSVRAKVLARRGRHREADQLASESVEIGEPTDYLFVRGDSLCDLAEVRYLAGRREEASQAAAVAIALYERKEDLASVRRTRELMSSELA